MCKICTPNDILVITLLLNNNRYGIGYIRIKKIQRFFTVIRNDYMITWQIEFILIYVIYRFYIYLKSHIFILTLKL